MTQPTILYGASDDLIEVNGAVRDEFNVHDTTDVTITLTDHGTVTLRFTYDDDGIWRIEPLFAPNQIIEILPEVDVDGDNYTLTVDADDYVFRNVRSYVFRNVAAYSQVAIIRIPVTSVAAQTIR